MTKKKCSVEKRARYERKCMDAGITKKAGILRCIVDCCYKMKPFIERAAEIAKKEAELRLASKPKVIIPVPIARNPGICYSLGDPHYKTFNNKYFNNYWVGDFVLVSSKDFTVHTRTRRWGAASVNKRISANLSGDIVEAKCAEKFRLNGDMEVELKVGQKYRLPKGGVVERISSHRAYYYSYQAGYLDAEYIGTGSNRYVNLIVNVPHVPDTTGACQGNMIKAHGLFRHEVVARRRKHEMKVSKRCHERARKRCIKKKE